MTGETKLEPFPVNVRIKISALWVAMLFAFAFVGIFSLYRADFRADLEAGEIIGLEIDEWFLFGVTAYAVIPSLMVFLTLVLRPRVNRVVNIVLSILYTLTIIIGAAGEWGYYVFGSAIEVALLVTIAYYAWAWPREGAPSRSGG